MCNDLILDRPNEINVEKMNILGISAYYHDSAAALLSDGALIAAAQEERFSRKKHDARFPGQAIDYCLSEASLRIADLDYIVFYDKPLLKFERLLQTYLSFAPKGFQSFDAAMPIWLKDKLFLKSQVVREVQVPSNCSASSLRYSKPVESRTLSDWKPMLPPPARRWVSA